MWVNLFCIQLFTCGEASRSTDRLSPPSPPSPAIVKQSDQEESLVTTVEMVSDEVASLVGKEDIEDVRPYLAPPRILQTLICPGTLFSAVVKFILAELFSKSCSQ